MVLFWFRRDLRFEDNHALYRALKSGSDVMPIFIYDSDITNKLNKNDHRLKYISETIEKLNRKLEAKKKKIYTFSGKPINIIVDLIKKLNVKEIYLNKDYEPYARERDDEIKKKCETNGVIFRSFKDHVIFEENEIVKKDGTPYVVYTPYSKQWIDKFKSNTINTFNSEGNLECLVDPRKINNNDYKIGLNKSTIQPIKYSLDNSVIDKYELSLIHI